MMDIHELEFIRDFQGSLMDLEDDLTNFHLIFGDILECDESHTVLENYTKSLKNQAELIQKLFTFFKVNVDKKYYNVWRAKHPDMLDTYQHE